MYQNDVQFLTKVHSKHISFSIILFCQLHDLYLRKHGLLSQSTKNIV